MLINSNAPSPARMPAFYIPHGAGPCFFMDWTMGPRDTWKPLQRFLESLAQTLPRKPRAIVLVSAHWEESAFTVSHQAKPALMFDYSGFPAHTYALTYSAPGAPELADRITEMLATAGLPTQPGVDRNWDHGVFIPLKLVFPDADIPIVQLSLSNSLDARLHRAAGRALDALRDDDVLIIGSGMSFHNIRALMQGSGAASLAANAFDQWLSTSVVDHAGESRNLALDHWESAPSARTAHPREEHLLPLMVVAGAAENERAARVFGEPVGGLPISAFRFG